MLGTRWRNSALALGAALLFAGLAKAEDDGDTIRLGRAPADDATIQRADLKTGDNADIQLVRGGGGGHGGGGHGGGGFHGGGFGGGFHGGGFGGFHGGGFQANSGHLGHDHGFRDHRFRNRGFGSYDYGYSDYCYPYYPVYTGYCDYQY